MQAISVMKNSKGKGAARVSKESLKPVDNRKVGKRKAAAVVGNGSKWKAKNEKNAKKDPNKPKRPASAFFVFLEEFRQTFKKENPNVTAVSAVGKAGGEKWKSLSAAEKSPYEAKAAKRKDDYEKLMNDYNKKQRREQMMKGIRSPKSKPEVDEGVEATGEVVEATGEQGLEEEEEEKEEEEEEEEDEDEETDDE